MDLKTNDPALTSWVEVPKDSDFPIQNLPFGVFKTSGRSARTGVAIGDKILDLEFLSDRGYFDSMDLRKGIFHQGSLNEFIGLGKAVTNKIRTHVSDLLRSDNAELRDRNHAESALIDMKNAEMMLPITVGDYTDFYSSEQHAINVGSMFRDPDNALLPNWKHIPVAYHGRASSIVVSGTPVYRPKGQVKPDDQDIPSYGPSMLLDFELEVACIAGKNSMMGASISTSDADDHIFGFVLFNDWSARDIQKWEYVPLGPFLAKNFASSISPWIVTTEALEPFRTAGPKQDPEVLPYLKYEGNCHYDIDLEVLLETEETEAQVLSRSNFKHMYWNVHQQLAHHTVNGCNIRVGDMLASGTISGQDPGSFGSMLELTWKGTRPIKLSDGSERKFIEDNDTVIMKGYAKHHGIRIGFGEVRNKILPVK